MKIQFVNSGRSWLFLLVILTTAGVLRFIELDKQSLWNDELHSMVGASPAKSLDEVIEYAKIDQPPFYFILLNTWFKVMPYTAVSARLLSAIFGVLGVYAVFLLGKEVKNDRVGLLSAGLTTFSYFHIYYSQEARFYSLLFVVSTFSYFFFIRAVKYGGLVNFSAYVTVMTLTIYTHYFGLVVLASQAVLFVAVIVFLKRDVKFIASSVVAGILVIVLIIPWMPQFFQDSKILSFWIEPVYFPIFLIKFLYGYFKDPVVAAISGALVVWLVWNLICSRIKRKEKINVEVAILLGWLILGFGIPYLYSVVKMPMLIIRYTMIVVPAVFVLIAIAIDRLSKKNITIVASVIIVSTVINFIFIQKYYREITKEQIREAAQVVSSQNEERNIVFSDHSWHFNYYLDLFHSNVRAVNPWDTDYKSILKKEKSVWILSVGDALWPPLTDELQTQQFTLVKNMEYFRTKAQLYRKTTKE